MQGLYIPNSRSRKNSKNSKNSKFVDNFGGHIPYNEQFFITRLLDELCEDTRLGNFQVVQEKTRVLTCKLSNVITITLSANFFLRCSSVNDDDIPLVEYYYQTVFTNTITKKIIETNKYFFTRSSQALVHETVINHIVDYTDNFC